MTYIIILLVILLGYSIYLSIVERRLRKKHFVNQVRVFIDNMRKLDLSNADIVDLLTKYNSYNELVNANKKLKNSVKKYNL